MPARTRTRSRAPLADALRSAGLTVWFDEQELVLGDSLRERIEHGVVHSTLGVVILSHAFFAKRWPQQELNGLYARLVGGEDNVIVPIWHHLSREQLTSYAPALADILAGESSEGIEKLTEQITTDTGEAQAAQYDHAERAYRA